METPETRTDKNAVEISNASFFYGQKCVLKGITGGLLRGNALALLGPNGSGKTTLLRGLLGAVTAKGTVRVLGRVPGRTPKGAVGYVPQLSDLDANFPVRVIDVVEMGLYSQLGFFRRPGRSTRNKAMQELEKVGLADRAKDRFGTLSGGQQQRVLLARCMIAKPQLILLDEPFNGLDTPSRKNLLTSMQEMTTSGVSIVVSTHDLIIAREACDTVALIAGRQIAFGPKDDVLTDDLLAEAYGA